MNPRKLMAVALCAAACVTTAMFAEETKSDSGFDTAVGDSALNLQSGLIYEAYTINEWMGENALKDADSILSKKGLLKSGVDTSEKFSIECAAGEQPKIMRWKGFLECKRTGTYSFRVQKDAKGWSSPWPNGYSIKINDKTYITSNGTDGFFADMNIGCANKIEIVCQFGNPDPLVLSAKLKSSIENHVPLTPSSKCFFHNQPLENETGF